MMAMVLKGSTMRGAPETFAPMRPVVAGVEIPPFAAGFRLACDRHGRRRHQRRLEP